jgi:hypothetical protein
MTDKAKRKFEEIWFKNPFIHHIALRKILNQCVENKELTQLEAIEAYNFYKAKQKEAVASEN